MMTTLRSLARRLLRDERPPRPWRPSWLPAGHTLKSEAKLHPHVPEERAELFLGFETGTTEMEVLNWLNATLMVLKPTCILETGAAAGLGTIALASACRDNGFGKVHSVELDRPTMEAASARLAKAGLGDYVEWHCADSRDFIRGFDGCFEFGFFDSRCEIRGEECRIALELGKLKGPAVFHDTSPLRTKSLPDMPTPEEHERFRREVHELSAKHYGGRILESSLSRGFIALFPSP